jgi:hypothetical protein
MTIIVSRTGEQPSKNLINSISGSTPLMSSKFTNLSLLSTESEGHSVFQKSESSADVEAAMSNEPCQIQSNKHEVINLKYLII